MADPNDPAIIRAAEDLGFVARNLRLAGHNGLAEDFAVIAAALREGDESAVRAAAASARGALATQRPTPPPAPSAPETVVLDGAGGTAVPPQPQEPAAEELIAALGENPAVISFGPDGDVELVTGPGLAVPEYDEYDEYDEHDEYEEYEEYRAGPVTVEVRFDACGDVDPDTVRAGLDSMLEMLGEHRYVDLDADAGTATVEVTPSGSVVLSPGSVATVGVTAIAGQVTNVYAVVPDEAGDVAQAEAFFASVDEHLQGARDAAAAWGEEGPQARPTFTVAYRGDDGPLSDEQVQPVLDLAARTLSRFGQLVPTSITSSEDGTRVQYAVLEEGELSTAALGSTGLGWGGTVDVPGVGRVTASIVT